MLCGLHCSSQLSTMLNNIVTLDSGSSGLNKIVQYCYTRFRLKWAQQYCSILLTTVNYNVGRTTLFNPVKQQAHNFYINTFTPVNNTCHMKTCHIKFVA